MQIDTPEELEAVLREYSRRHKSIVLAIHVPEDLSDVRFNAFGISDSNALEVLEITATQLRERAALEGGA